MDVVNIIGFGIDSAPAEQGAKRTNSALDSVQKKSDETIKAAQKFGKELGEAFKLQNLSSYGRGIAGEFDKIKTSATSLFSSVRQLASGIRGDFLGALGQAKDSVIGLKGAFGDAGGAGGSLIPILGGVAVGLAAIAVVGVAVGAGLARRFFEMAKEGSDLGGKMLDLSNNTGLAVKSLSFYKIAAEQSGSSVDTLVRGVELLERKLQDAASGDKKSAGLFKALGIEAKKAGEDPQKAFEDLAGKIASIEDPVLRVKVATELLGKSGANLISTFITMKEDGDALKARMTELGLVMGTDVVKGADAIGDEFVILGAVSDALKIKIARELAPQIVAGVQSIESSLAKLTPFIVNVAATFVSQFAPVVGILSLVADKIDDVFGGKKTRDRDKKLLAEGAKIDEERRQRNSGVALPGTKARTFSIDSTSGLPDIFGTQEQQAADDKLRKLLATRYDKKGSGAKASAGEDSLRSAQIAAQKAFADEAVKLTKDQIQREEKALKDYFDQGLISTSEYYRSRYQIASGAIDQEIELLAKEQAALEKQQKEVKGDGNKAKAERLKLDIDILKVQDEQIIKQRELTAAIREEVTGLREANAQLLKGLALKGNENIGSQLIPDSAIEQAQKLAPIIRQVREDREALFGRANVDFLGNAGTEGGKTFSRSQQLESGLRAEQAAVQAKVNAGVESELDARKEILSIESKYRDALIDALAAERDLAASAGDLSKAFDIQGQIEGLKNFGTELSNSQRLLKGLQDTKSIGDKFEELGGNIKSSLTDAFRAGFETGPKGFFDSLKSNFKRTLAQMAADFATSKLLELFFGKKQAPSFGSAPAATGASGGGGVLGSLSSLVSGNSGSGQASGGGGGIGSFLTGGFAGGPSPASGGGGGQSSGLLGGLLGLFRGGGKGAASAAAGGGEDFAGALNAISGGGKGASGATGFLSKIPLLGSLFGGGGGGAGAAAGAGKSLFGGAGFGIAGTLGLVTGGALLALPLILPLFSKLFGGGELKKFSKETEALYAVKVKNDKEGQSVYQQAKQIGEQAFGKGKFKDHIKETIGIKEVKDLIAQYGLSTGQDNSPLVKRYQATQDIVQSGNGANNFTKRAFGGDVYGGGSYLVGDGGRSEVFKPKVSGTIFPSIESYLQSNLQSQIKLQLRGFGGASVVNTGGNAQEAAGTRAVLGQLIQVLSRIGTIDANSILQMMPAEGVADKVGDGFQRNTTAAIKTQRVLGVATT